MSPLTPLETEALLLSLKVALWAVLVSLPVGVSIAWLLARRRFSGHALLNGVVHLPLILPPVVIGYLLLVLLGRQGAIGGWLFDVFGVTIAFTWKGAAVASGIMAFPLLVRAVRLSLESMDRKLEQAARTLGAGPIRVFLTVTVPMIMPGVLTGTILAFARSLGEFGATITFVSNIPGETRTLPLALFTLTQTVDGETGAFRLMIISIAIALIALIGSEVLSRRVAARIGTTA
jgi:molybdate transport system permease protein